MNINRVVKRYRAPEGGETKITPEHFIGRVVDILNDDDIPDRIDIGPDELPEQAQASVVARRIRERASERANDRRSDNRPQPSNNRPRPPK